MAGNARFELTSGSPEPGFVGNYPNGQRGNYPGPSLDRSGSFREGGESRLYNSGTGMSRGGGTLMGDLPPLSQCLMLEPMMMGDQKYTRAGELRRVLGFSIGSALEDNSFGAAHSKPPPPVAMDELKRYKTSVLDGCIKARGRAKKLDEHLHKLNKYCEAINSKKQQRNELLTNERSGGSNLKMGTQIHRNPLDLVTQRLEDRAKNVVLNKRVRTSVAETRVECRSNGLPRQPLVMAKDRDMLKDSGAGCDLVEEKTHRMPAGGEGWDKKMKKKRSVGTVFTRPIDSDGELKRAMHHKLNTEPGLQTCDAHGFRSGSSNCNSGINKSDSTSLPASSNTRATPKNELEKPILPRDITAGLNKERLLAKGNKLNIREDNHIAGPSTMTKGKASRAPRTGFVVATNSSPNIPRVSGALESWEQAPSVNKIHSIGGANNRKRAMASGSSSPPITQWVGQRPQKISRTRRANLVSPVSNHDEMQLSSEGCSPSDFGGRMTSGGTNTLLLSRGAATGTQQFKVKLESVSSPARLSESEESGAGENRLKDKSINSGEVEEKAVNVVLNVGSSIMLTKKNKLLIKEEIGDGVRRQGRSGRGSSFSRASISPIREKLESAATTKPLRSTRPSSDKNGSKSGRPLKRLSDRKGFSRLGHMANSSSPDFNGESDDDHEDLLAAANFACNSSYLACSSLFWKKMEPIFASVSLEEPSYLLQQLKFAEELYETLSQMFGQGNNVLGDLVHGEISVSDTLVTGERDRSLQNQINSKGSARTVDLVDQIQDVETLCGRLDLEGRFNKITPLCQRVLSALIAEDEIEEFEENGMGRNVLLQCATDDSSYDTCLPIDAEHRKSVFGVQTQKQFTANRFFSCNGSTTSDRSLSIQNPPCDDELLPGDGGFVHLEVGVLAGLSGDDLDGSQIVKNGFGISSFDCQYEQMCLDDKLLLELQSIGLYPETVPYLDDTENELIHEEIVQLKKGLHQQIGKKKACLDKIYKAIQGGREAERRDLEQVAMNRLVELAYKKLLSTRGSSASKSGIAKVPKQVALAFAKRTLARCRKFEDLGTSCFGEPALRDVIFAAPLWGNEAEPLACLGPAVANYKHPESCNPQPDPTASGSFPGSAEWHDFHNKIDTSSLETFETFTPQSDQAFAKNGPISNRGKKKEVLLDDVGGSAALRATSTLGSSLLGGTKGKRSERERDKDTSNTSVVAKAGCPSLVNVKGERKTKTKPKQKTAQLSAASGSGFVNKFAETTHPVYPSSGVTDSSDRKGEVGLMSTGNIPQDSSKKIKDPVDLQLHELDSIEELGVDPDLGGPQDLISWFNFDEDGLQDHDSMGLEIPMDDLSELNMF